MVPHTIPIYLGLDALVEAGCMFLYSGEETGEPKEKPSRHKVNRQNVLDQTILTFNPGQTCYGEAT